MLAAPAAMAQNYAENLVVSINGESTDPVPASIDVQKKENGTCTFMLKNFMLAAGESSIPVGTIVLEGVTMTEADGQTTLETTQTIRIQAGDLADVPVDDWLGPNLGDVPIVMSGKIVGDNLLANIDIDMSATLEQIINVKLGTDEGFPEIPEGIEHIDAAQGNATVIYDLNGVRQMQPLSRLAKGVYVVNGRKVVK